MAKKLVIVESPAKAKTISKILGSDYVIKASYGHVRDLPKKNLSVDVEHNYEPVYQIIPKAKKVIADLKKDAGNASEVYLATDSDREGEAIAWHVSTALGLDKPKAPATKRITFHEITASAIKKAIEQPRELNKDLIDAQQARRVLDRLVGYKLSPLLWQKVYYGLSAGRVQSVAVRLIVEREREIKDFKPREYWTVAVMLKSGKSEPFKAYVTSENSSQPAEFNEKEADALAKHLAGKKVSIKEINETDAQVKPGAPLITSTLQQQAARYLHFSAKKTMKLAQDLYEGVDVGEDTVALITYMRTDSYQMADEAKKAASEHIKDKYGAKYLPETPHDFTKKVRGAQEAHEAIRPVDFTKTPEEMTKLLDRDHARLYGLIWRVAMASQMASAKVTNKVAKGEVIGPDKKPINLVARGRVLDFDGHLKLIPDGEDRFESLPEFKQGDSLPVDAIEPVQHFTEPPARYSEASLVKELEERGIGRPSTYAPIVSTIVDRGYVVKKVSRFHPEAVAEVVTDLLVDNFPDVIDYNFTAEMEDELDDIADGKKKMLEVLDKFYKPFAKELKDKEKTIDKKDLVEQESDKKCPDCGKKMVIKLGRFGQFLSCSDYPTCKHHEPYLENQFTEEEEKEIAEETKEKCPKCGGAVAVKQGRFGTFLGCSTYPDCDFTKPITITAEAPCPNCGKELVRKNTRRGRTFWGCSGYPKCKTAFWDEPTKEKCPTCSNLLLKVSSGLKCSQCDYTRDQEEIDAEQEEAKKVATAKK